MTEAGEEDTPNTDGARTGSHFIDSMSDAALGSFCRQVMKAFTTERESDPGSLRSGSSLAAMYLVGRCIDIEAGDASFDLYGLTIGDRELGDWVVTVREKVGEDADDSERGPPVVLGGHLKPEKVEDALACFDKLTIMKLRMARNNAKPE